MSYLTTGGGAAEKVGRVRQPASQQKIERDCCAAAYIRRSGLSCVDRADLMFHVNTQVRGAAAPLQGMQEWRVRCRLQRHVPYFFYNQTHPHSHALYNWGMLSECAAAAATTAARCSPFVFFLSPAAPANHPRALTTPCLSVETKMRLLLICNPL